MSRAPADIRAVVDSHLCCGCGVCAYLAPEVFRMVDVPSLGRRPEGPPDPRAGDDEAVRACPGRTLSHPPRHDPDCIPGLLADWGPILEVWEGHATDPEVRHAGSSGGAATALCEFFLAERGASGVLQTAADPDAPHLNRTVFSTTRDQVRACSGSRYSPASPCEGLAAVERAAAPAVFVGKPCDAAATRMAAALRPRLANNLGLVLAVFCAGTPATAGTLELLRALGAPDPGAVTALRYRGRGWPGDAVAQTASGPRSMTYERAWSGILQRHRPWRCYLCPDHTGEFADIALGDPWHTPPQDGEPGRSLLVVRTRTGQQALEAAMAAGYLTAAPAAPEVLALSQPNLLRVRGGGWPDGCWPAGCWASQPPGTETCPWAAPGGSCPARRSSAPCSARCAARPCAGPASQRRPCETARHAEPGATALPGFSDTPPRGILWA